MTDVRHTVPLSLTLLFTLLLGALPAEGLAASDDNTARLQQLREQIHDLRKELDKPPPCCANSTSRFAGRSAN